jgi:hypothetical protein
MDEARLRRKIAVIMAADVCGYSRLVAEDEDEVGTLKRLMDYREIFADFVGSGRGRETVSLRRHCGVGTDRSGTGRGHRMTAHTPSAILVGSDRSLPKLIRRLRSCGASPVRFTRSTPGPLSL